MRIVACLRKLRGICASALPKPASRDFRQQLVPNLFVRQLEERRVLSATPLSPDDGTQQVTLGAGDLADDGTADTFEVVRQDDQVEVSLNGNQIYNASLANVQRITVEGSGDDDLFIVDYSGGNPLPGGGIVFQGMGQSDGGKDVLQIDGGAVDGGIETLTHQFDRVGEGLIHVASHGEDALGKAAPLTYSGVEFVNDHSGAQTLHFQLNAGAETVTISDDGNADDGESIIRSSRGTSVSFGAAVTSLTVDARGAEDSGNDVIRVDGLDSQCAADVTLLGDGGDEIRFSGDVDLGGGNLTAAAGSIQFDGALVSRGATVQLDAGSDGTLLVSGSIDVSDAGAGSTGGTVELLGDRVGLLGDARVDVSGDAGGGTVLVGGDYRGENPGVRNASLTAVGQNALISANALTTGDAGKVVVWADGVTRFYGHVDARGGVRAGDGGFVEVSGKQHLDFRGTVDTRAPGGSMGVLLLDPNDLTIIDGVGPGTQDFNLPQIFAGDPPPPPPPLPPSTVAEATLEGLAFGANVILEATGQITVANLTDDLLNMAQTTGSLRITSTATNGITFADANDEIRSAGGALTLEAQGTGSLQNIGKLTTNGGALLLKSNGGMTLAGAINAGAVTVTSVGAVVLNADIVTAGATIAFSSGVEVGNAQTVTINSANGVAAGADVTFGGTVDGQAPPAGGETLSVNAGTGGNVQFQDAVGGTAILDVTITNSNSTTFSNTVTAGTLVLTDTTGAVTFSGNVTINALNTTAQAYAVALHGALNVVDTDTTFNNTTTVT
ncbi:MAG: hypothetical protein HQ567_09785, partial [Candidatus Nealsonbacteria bacterium]|nr:hypothetical protein [Candidatus Nealsonbacteria bacterium]